MISIAAIVHDPQERAAIVKAAGGERHVLFCGTGQELAGIAATPGLRALVYEWNAPALAELEPVIQSVKTQPDRPALVVYGPLTVAWARDLLRLAASGLDVRAVIRGFEDMGAAVRPLCLGPGSPAADATILRRIARLLRPPSSQIVVGAVLAGKRRLNVKDLARRCGLVVRTMEHRLVRSRLPQAWRLLGWSVSLHGLWRMDVLEWPVKRAAVEAGFQGAAAFSACVKRHCGETPTHLRDSIGFPGLLERFAELLHGRGGRGHGART